MKNGKKLCNELREVRRKIAEANDIPYAPEVCTHEDDCMGTCPKCEAEVRYIERQLNARQRLGKAVAIIGLATCTTAMAPMLSSCKNQPLQGEEPWNDALQGDVAAPTTDTTECATDTNAVTFVPDTPNSEE